MPTKGMISSAPGTAAIDNAFECLFASCVNLVRGT